MDKIESTSLSGSPTHAKYKASVLAEDVFFHRLMTLQRVSVVRCVSWGTCLALGCLQRFARDLSCVLWANRSNQAGGWAPAVPGAGLLGWQSPGEVTPVCQNLPMGSCFLSEWVLSFTSLMCGSLTGREVNSWRWRKLLLLFSPACLSHPGCIQQY